MFYCPECGSRLEAEARFCAKCGTALAATRQPPRTAGEASSTDGTRERQQADDPRGGSVGNGATVPLPIVHPAPPTPAGHHLKAGTKALLAATVALVLAILGGTAALASHNAGQRRALPVPAPVATTTTTTPTTTTQPATPTATLTSTAQTFPALYRQTSDGVVRIETTACNGGGVGSGFLLAPDLVATVAHVVDGAVSIVIRQNGITTTGTVIGIDTHAEVALVRTRNPLTGHVFTLDTGQPEVGTDVGAIGYPLGGPESLTKGAISGLGRTIDVGDGPLDGLIQTDTALNPGNSGGPLLSVDGTVVGLVEAGNTEANGISYAIPAQSAAIQLQRWRESPGAVPGGSGCSSPVGPSGVRVSINDQSGNPDGKGIAATFAAYADGINTGSYDTAYALLSPHAQSLTSLDAFRQGEASSYIVTLLITQVSQAGDKDTAEVEFTSVQDPVAGGTGQACSNWNIAYTLIPGDAGWLIDTALPHPGSPAAC